MSTLDFVITRVLMKLFKSANVSIINDSRLFFKVLLPREILEKEEGWLSPTERASAG